MGLVNLNAFLDILPCTLFFHVVLQRFTIEQHEHQDELPKQQVFLGFWWILCSIVQQLWSKINWFIGSVWVNLVQFSFNEEVDICLTFVY